MRVAVCQMRSGEDVGANVAEAERLLGEAAEGGADLAVLPEVFPYLGPSSRRAELAEPVPGPVTDRLAAVAASRAMWVLGGSVLERDGDRVYNAAPLFDRAGELVVRYRKIHLFDVELPGQPPFRESATFTTGTCCCGPARSRISATSSRRGSGARSGTRSAADARSGTA
jgi:predicted amidohydrolase